jgi:serine protease Do
MIPRVDILPAAYAQALQPQFGFADIVDKIKPAVISVSVRLNEGADTGARGVAPQESPLERFFRRFAQPDDDSAPLLPRNTLMRQGSGFFITADGYAVTNNHVVEGVSTVEVKTDAGKIYTAKVVGADRRTDVALIKVDGRSDFPTVKFAERIPRVGDWVLAVGNPFGLGGTVTAGIVSARGRDIGSSAYDDFLQIDAPVNVGNSGGPSFNIEGDVIGVNTAIFSPSGGSVGIGFAVPADIVKPVIDQLKERGKVTRGWIGVQIQEITPDLAENLGLKEARGALVAEPQPNGPAIKAGIEAGDVIIAVDGKALADSRALARMIGGMPPGTAVKLTVVRQGQEKIITVTLGELPEQREAALTLPMREPKGSKIPQFGLSVVPRPGGDGMEVTELEPNGPAAEHGFKPGDIILEVAGKKVATTGDLRTAIQAAEKSGKRTVLVRMKTGDATRYVTLPIHRG